MSVLMVWLPVWVVAGRGTSSIFIYSLWFYNTINQSTVSDLYLHQLVNICDFKLMKALRRQKATQQRSNTHTHTCCRQVVLSFTDLADVSSSQTHQGGEPVCDVEQSFGHSPPASQQRTVHEGHAADPPLPVRALATQTQPRTQQVKTTFFVYR